MNLSLLPVLFTSIATGLCFAYRGAVSPWTTRRNAILNPMVTRASRHEFSTHRECQYSAKPSITLDHLSLLARGTEHTSSCDPILLPPMANEQHSRLSVQTVVSSSHPQHTHCTKCVHRVFVANSGSWNLSDVARMYCLL